MVLSRGDHIVPNFEEIWPSNKDKDSKYKRNQIGEYFNLKLNPTFVP